MGVSLEAGRTVLVVRETAERRLTMHIQKATAADLPKAMQCYEEIIDKTPGIEHLAMWRKGQHPTEETILSYINKGEFYILWDHETIAGMMALANGISETYRTVNWITKATDTEAAELHVLGVSPDYQGKGIARQLIHKALCLCKENGKKVLRLDVIGTNTVAKSSILLKALYFVIPVICLSAAMRIWNFCFMNKD